MTTKTASTTVALLCGALFMLGAAQASAGSPSKNYGRCLTTKPIKFDGTIAEAAIATPELSTLVDLVVAAGLDGALSAPGNLTVFAPTNDAFSAIPGPLLAAIGGDDDVLNSVLTYHVVPGRVDPRKSLVPREVTTLQGQTVFLGYDGNPQINQSNTDCQAVRATNGTMWIVDSVLLPQF